jgi:pimeloyl-ACP methyl ester carboxylesterase
MKADKRFLRGDKGKPVAVFIHGLGMNADFWSDPSRARVLGGRYPLRILLGTDAEEETTFQDLLRMGWSVLTWSQSRPAGPIAAAVRELGEILDEFQKETREGVFFVCHSRGGLVARKYLEDPASAVRGVVTISTPHAGTSMARWAAFLSPGASVMMRLLGGTDKKETNTALRKILGFLGSRGLKELLPESDFYQGLKDKKRRGIKYVSIGGTAPDLLRALAVPLPELLAKAVPDRVLPEEMRAGRGDGLVSAASSVLPYADEHLDFPLNHASIAFDRRVRRHIIRVAKAING